MAIDFEVRKARADDGGADNDLGTVLAIVDSSTGCMRAQRERQGATDFLASSVADSVKNLFVETTLRQRTPRSWRWRRK